MGIVRTRLAAMKPYQHIPIRDCREPLVPIPLELFAVQDPHPYVKLNAPYGNKSPYYLRRGVLERLIQAQRSLQQQHPKWRILIFDAYRPIAVQQYMVDYSFTQTVAAQGKRVEQLTPQERQAILEDVYQFWAAPSHDPATPPPHSTGAAIDITLVDDDGVEVNMGSPIDEMSSRSFPDYFADESNCSLPQATRITIHNNRLLLKQIMANAGFQQHPKEWWHFSWGDQMWAWLTQHTTPSQANSTHATPPEHPTACYGAIEND